PLQPHSSLHCATSIVRRTYVSGSASFIVGHIEKTSSGASGFIAGMTVSFSAVRPRHLLDEDWREMEITGRPALRLDVAVHTFNLGSAEPRSRRDIARPNAVVQPVEAQIERVKRNRKIEFFLRLRERVCVGGRRAPADLC